MWLLASLCLLLYVKCQMCNIMFSLMRDPVSWCHWDVTCYPVIDALLWLLPVCPLLFCIIYIDMQHYKPIFHQWEYLAEPIFIHISLALGVYIADDRRKWWSLWETCWGLVRSRTPVPRYKATALSSIAQDCKQEHNFQSAQNWKKNLIPQKVTILIFWCLKLTLLVEPRIKLITNWGYYCPKPKRSH